VVDLQHDDPLAGDVYVLCSDGLSGMIQDEEIQRIVAGAPDIRVACKQLIERANEHGGEDNITAVLIKIEDQRDSQAEVVSGNADTERGNKLVVDVAKSAGQKLPDAKAPQDKPLNEVKIITDSASRSAAASDKDFGEAETSPGFVLVTPVLPKK